MHSDSGTPHFCAAAAISIWRPPAPTWRSGSQFIGVAVLPPAICKPYFGLRSACSTRTSFQSTSSSSAISMGSMVFTPWPISGFFAMIVTTPSGAMRMNEAGTSVTGGPNWAASTSVIGSR